ncbi:MAG: LysR family transcriptional regulator [Solobacterium sp.]|nr:LysR family transcriptional regulator [Solobacterium sp.]
MNTKQFDYFTAIADAGSFAGAERLSGISRSVLYRYLTGLEQQLGTELFERDSGELKLNKAGKQYQLGIMRMKDVIARMQRDLQMIDGERVRELRLGIPPAFGANSLADLTPALFSIYPTLEISPMEDTTSALVKALKEDRISCVLSLYDARLFPNTKIAQCTESELLLVLPGIHPVSRKYGQHGQRIHDISHEDLLSLSDIEFICLSTGTVVGQITDRVLHQFGLKPRIFFRLQNSAALYRLVRSGNFACFFAEDVIPEDNDLVLFHLPVRTFIRGGLIFRENYEPTVEEETLFSLFSNLRMHIHPETVSMNDLAKTMLAHAKETNYGNPNF